MYLRVKAVVAQEVDRYRDGRLVDRLPGGEPGEEVETLLDGERPVGDGPGPLGEPHPPGQFSADHLFLPPDARVQEGPGGWALVSRDHRDAGSLAFLLRGRVVAEVAFAVVVEEPADA